MCGSEGGARGLSTAVMESKGKDFAFDGGWLRSLLVLLLVSNGETFRLST